MPRVVSLRIVSSNDNEQNLSLNAGEYLDFELPFNASSGTWILFSSFEGIIEEREFEVK